MKLEDFVIYVSAKCGSSKYVPPINEEQFDKLVLLIKRSKSIEKQTNSSPLMGNFLILEECCKSFNVNKLDLWFLVKELRRLLK